MRNDILNCRLDANALGDNVCWVPVVEEYRKQTGKTVLVSTFFNQLFAPVYPELVFCEPNNILQNIPRVYIGVAVDNDRDNQFSHKNWRTQPLQKVASDVLGIEYKPIQPKVYIPDIEIPYRNYICISEHTSRKSKYWHHPNGWQDVVDYCNSVGVNVVVCSKEPTQLKGVIDRTGDHPIENRCALINRARAFIGVSSGLYWIAQSVNTPSLLISGATEHDHEYVWNGHRISTPKGFCSGCINRPEMGEFNDKLDCPENKDYECSKEITSDMVISKLKEVLWKEDTYVFDVKNEKDAKDIILTPESGVTTEERWERETEILKNEFIDHLQLMDKKVMDYGCGIGRLSKVLIPFVKEVHGVDISRDMLKLAKDYVDSDRFYPKHVSEIEDEKYDVVICSWVLQHINNVEEVMDMIKDKLNDGGQLFVLNNEYVDAIPQGGNWGLRKSSIKEYLNNNFKKVIEYKQEEINNTVDSFIGIYKKED
jgi:autotransporter strand-loop-strand O-heptosyltransferase